MPQAESIHPRIELDPRDVGMSAGGARRLRPVSQAALPPAPLLVPALPPGGVGSDEAERTVGYLILLSALPAGISTLVRPGILGLVSFALTVYLGLGILRKDDFVIRWVNYAYGLLLAKAILLALAGLMSVWGSLGSILAGLAVLVLLSGRALKRSTYRICLGAILLGSLLGVLGALRGSSGACPGPAAHSGAR